MLNKRLIARLDIKAPNLVKGIQLEGLRVMGDPALFARRYYAQGIDEIFYQDVVASLYGRNGLIELVKSTSDSIFVPLMVGGGLRSVADMRAVILAGADKVCINTAAVHRPLLISEGAKAFGCQCITVAIEYIGEMAFTDNGREETGLNAFDWARKAVDYGAGELVLTSVERDGRKTGYDCDFIAKVAQATGVPVVAHGGAGNALHCQQAMDAGANAVAVASVLHYGIESVTGIKAKIIGHPIRQSSPDTSLLVCKE